MTIKYPFNKEGIENFLDDSLEDIHEALASENPDDINDHDVYITIGSRTVRIPIYAEVYEELSDFLNNTIKIMEDE